MAAVIKAEVRSILSPHITVPHKQLQANMAHHLSLVREVSISGLKVRFLSSLHSVGSIKVKSFMENVPLPFKGMVQKL